MHRVWVGGLTALLAACGTDAPLTTPATPARLTGTEYANTLRDLVDPALGDPILPPEPTVDGFEGRIEVQEPSAWLVEAQADFAELAATRWLLREPVQACLQDGDAQQQATCTWEAVLGFATQAWRRPLDEGQRERLEAFYRARLAELNIPAAALLTVQGILQSPAFLYRIEPGEPGEPLDGWSMAARLSYLLWDSAPDAALREAAYRGELDTAEGVAAQARRMLEDPRARSAVVSFHAQWLELDRIATIRVDEALYFGLMPSVPASEQLRRIQLATRFEAERFVEDALFDGAGTLGELLTRRTTWVSAETRGLYGIDESDQLDEPAWVAWNDSNARTAVILHQALLPEDQRAGLLTLIGPLASRAHPIQPSPILRGVFLVDRLRCDELGTPPAGAFRMGASDVVSDDATNRERVEAATSSEACSGCHDRIDPPGFAFEHYDSLGRWRDRDGSQPVDASGLIEGLGAFDDAVGLMDLLAHDPETHACYARHWVRYALGRDELPSEKEELARIQDAFFADGGDVKALLVEIARSDLFRHRPAEAP